MSTDRNISLLGIGLGGIISISSASGHYDFIDMAIGFILLSILWPTIKATKAGKLECLIVSMIAAVTTVLIFGIFIDYGIYRLHDYPQNLLASNNQKLITKEPISIFKNTQIFHFSLWVLSLVGFYITCLRQENLTRLSKIAQQEDAGLDAQKAARPL